MAARGTIRNPIEWGWDQLSDAAHAVGSAGRAFLDVEKQPYTSSVAVRRITVGDLRTVLAKGLDDFGAYRADVLFLCLIYPVIGIFLARMAFGDDMLPLLFPLASGFALIGPVAAVGLYEMSRRREQGIEIGWSDAFGVVASPRFAAIAVMGALLVAIFACWMYAAQSIYEATLGAQPGLTLGRFAQEVIDTPAGHAMILWGVGAGFLFAVGVLAISVVSFPLLLDRNVSVDMAVVTSLRAVMANPVPMAVWGLIVTGGLILGSLPLFIGLIVVMPVLGHATWHLYRAVVR